MSDYTDPYTYRERPPISSHLKVDAGKVDRHCRQTRSVKMTGGLSELNVNYKKATKVGKGHEEQKKQFLSNSGYEADSAQDMDWEESIESPDELAMSGEDKHFMQLLYQNEYTDSESNFF